MISALQKMDTGQVCDRVMRSYCGQVLREVHFCRMRQGGEPGEPLWEARSKQREWQVQMLRGRHEHGVSTEKQGSSGACEGVSEAVK